MSGTPYLKTLFDFKKLKRLRKSYGLSVYRVSLDSGVARGTIMALESGTVNNPNLETLTRLAGVYNVPVEDLLGVVRK